MTSAVRDFPSNLLPFKSTRQIIERGAAVEEYAVKGLVPRHGFGVLYGASQSLKSFISVDLGFHVALGRQWADRRVNSAPVCYVCAEGAGGIEKRINGFHRAHSELPTDAPFFVVSYAPNLGSPDTTDFNRLVSTINATGCRPGIVVIDTLQQCLGGADENGTGMINFIRHAQQLARVLECFVLAIHHVGWSAGDRVRGHSSLTGAADLQILSERLPNELASTLTVQKVKDGDAGFRLTATLRKVVLGRDPDGDEIGAGATRASRSPDGVERARRGPTGW
jgi:hypothetical protein